MKTLVIANQKGGVGKTTLAIHIAFEAMAQQQRVLFIDCDPQGNSTHVLSDYAEQVFNCHDLFDGEVELQSAQMVLAAGNHFLADVTEAGISKFAENVIKSSDFFDLCIIDTPPSLGTLQVSSLLVADYVISPFELNTFSINGISNMIQTLENIKKMNQKLKFLGMLPSRVNAYNQEQKALLATLNNEYSNFMFAGEVPERQAIGMTSSLKKAVWDIKENSSARTVGKALKATVQNILKAIMNGESS